MPRSNLPSWRQPASPHCCPTFGNCVKERGCQVITARSVTWHLRTSMTTADVEQRLAAIELAVGSFEGSGASLLSRLALVESQLEGIKQRDINRLLQASEAAQYALNTPSKSAAGSTTDGLT